MGTIAAVASMTAAGDIVAEWVAYDDNREAGIEEGIRSWRIQSLKVLEWRSV